MASTEMQELRARIAELGEGVDLGDLFDDRSAKTSCCALVLED